MSNFWTLPFDLFKDQPSDIATRLREYDLKARTYQAMGRFWTRMYRLIKGKKAQSEQQSEATTITNDFYNDLLKVFQKFKKGDEYNALNPLEKLNDRLTKQAHKMILGSDVVGDKALQDIQERMEEVWDDFWDLNADDRAGLDALLSKFAFDVWAAMGLSVSSAPVYGSASKGSANGAGNGAATSTAATQTQEMKLMGKGTVVYCPVVLPKKKVEAMIPSHIMTLESTGLDIADSEHVVIYALAKQTIDFGNGQKMVYQEVFPIIPHVSVPGITGQYFQAIPVLWVSNIAIAKGARDYWKLNKLYGSFKELTNFPLDAAHGLTKCSNVVKTSVEDDKGGFTEVTALAAQLESTQLKSQSSKDYAPFAPMQKLLASPMIYWQGNDLYIAEFAMDFTTSTIEGAKAKLKTGSLNGMDHAEHIVDSLENVATGAFKLNYDWVFSLPKPYPSMG